MDGETFAEIVQTQLAICSDVLVDKGREYATEDRLHNFKVAAEVQGITPMEALGGMMAKHTVSIFDMIASPEVFSLDVWSEKITDHMNYLILLRAVVAEEPDDEAVTVESALLRDVATAVNRYFLFDAKH